MELRPQVKGATRTNCFNKDLSLSCIHYFSALSFCFFSSFAEQSEQKDRVSL